MAIKYFSLTLHALYIAKINYSLNENLKMHVKTTFAALFSLIINNTRIYSNGSIHFENLNRTQNPFLERDLL